METQTIAPRKVIGVCLEAEQIARLDELAEQMDRPKSYLVRKAVAAYLSEIEALQAGAEAR